ncbi:MAG TPA: hypothetical protein VND93_34445, partial [Myxococcales bacterium]|nr:hypothetical protein [Myxococcales bacterium]
SGTMAAGTSTTSFYWRTTRSGAVNVGADEQNALWALQSHTVNPGPITQLQFIDPNNTTYVTQCSYVRTVQLKDTYGNPSPALSTTAVALTSGSSGGITFYSDSTCTVPITQVQIAAGANQASFYYKDNYAEGVYLYATVTGLPVASQYTYNYGRTWVISAAQTRDAGQCSGVTTVQTQNLSGVAYNVPTATTVWLYGSTGMNFYSEST